MVFEPLFLLLLLFPQLQNILPRMRLRIDVLCEGFQCFYFFLRFGEGGFLITEFLLCDGGSLLLVCCWIGAELLFEL